MKSQNSYNTLSSIYTVAIANCIIIVKITLNTGKSSSGIAVEETGIITGFASPRFSSTSYKVGAHRHIPTL